MNRNSNAAPRKVAPPGAGAANVLAAAARAVAAVLSEGRSADDALLFTERAAHRSAVRAVTLGALRWSLRLEPAVLPLLARPGKDTPVLLRTLLIVAVHQLEMSRNPRESTVSAAVDAARLLGQARAAGVINAVLRRFLRERDTLLQAVDNDLAQRTAHPGWLVEALTTAWPDDAVAILEASNQHPPMTLRVDRTRVSVADYQQQLLAVGIASQPVPWLPTALTLLTPVPVSKLPGFAEGVVSVQDASAQLAAHLLSAQSGERVLDACAAPGGKTGALLELTPGIEVTAVDRDAQRLGQVADNLRRLRREARLVGADLSVPQAGWAGKPFDRILLDAPCSATGVIRRHPDIKLLRRAADIPVLALQQAAILRQCWRMLRDGGTLLYATCSLLPEENAAVVAEFLASEPTAREHTPAMLAQLAFLRRCAVGWQLLPGGEAGGDGFYYACLTRIQAPATHNSP